MENKISTKVLLKEITNAIELAAESSGKDIYALTKTDLLKYTTLSEWQLRKVGGLAAVRKAHFPEPVDHVGKRGLAIQRSYINKLEKESGDWHYYKDAITEKMGEVLTQHPIKIVKAKSQSSKKQQSGKQREVVAFISDTHFGLRIDPEEIPSNSYNWTVAARRMGKFAEQVATYKIEHRASTPRLRLCLGGDLAQGIIHLSDAGTDLITNQVLGTVDILVKMIDYLRNFYQEIVVEAVPCNHLRLPHKGPGRAVAQKWDAFSTMIHTTLQMAYRQVDQVSFHVPKTPWADFTILGHRFFLTHGDTTLEVGNPGGAINTVRITNSINELNASTAGKRYEVIMVGHVHVPLSMTLSNGVELVVNGTGSGTDPFAQSIGIYSSNAVQTVFEVTEGYPVGDYRKIHLNDASNDPRYEQIISPWSHGLIVDKLEIHKK